MATLRDRELAQWLEQRLEPVADELWTSSRNLCSAMTKELLGNVPSCFVDLPTHVKLKVLLSIFYFPRRNIELWRDEIEDVLSLACQDTDEWVQTMAELLKEYPTTGGISFNMENDGSQFTKTLQELRKLLRRQAKGPCGQVLPLDAAFMNKQAAQSTWGVQVQQPSSASARYFSLKRKPKAAAQRIEFLQKSADAATQMKYKNGSLSSILPIRHKNTVRRMDDDTPMKGIGGQNQTRQSTPGFRPPSKPVNRQMSTSSPAGVRRVGSSSASGVKLIDINETPQALEKKRKAMEAEEKAAKKAAKEEQKRQRLEEKLQKKLEREQKQRSLQQEEEEMSEPASSSTAIDISTVASAAPSATPVIQPTPDYAAQLFEGAVSAARPMASEPIATGIPQAQRPVLMSPPPQPQTVLLGPLQSAVLSPQPIGLPQPAGLSPQPIGLPQPAGLSPQPIGLPQSTVLSPHPVVLPQSAVLPPQLPGASQSADKRPTFTITKDVMLKAQEMFRTANKLSRPEKALILGFMAGNRDNPCPQMGRVLTVRLSENQDVQAQPDGSTRPVMVETYFQMNYDTGEWKQIRKIRPLREGEGQTA